MFGGKSTEHKVIPLTPTQKADKIKADLAGNKILKIGMAASFAKASEQATVAYLSAITEQNFIIIEMLDKLTKEGKNNGNNESN